MQYSVKMPKHNIVHKENSNPIALINIRVLITKIVIIL